MSANVQTLGLIQDIKARLQALRDQLNLSAATNTANATAVSLIDTAYTNMAQVEQSIFTGAATPGAS